MPPSSRNQPPATPRYIAIAALVRDRIATERLGPHTLLPSERELADQHGVSRMTARQALSLLESEGVVYRNIKGAPKGYVQISRIEPSHFEPGTAYVAVDAHRLDDWAPYLFKTTDFGVRH